MIVWKLNQTGLDDGLDVGHEECIRCVYINTHTHTISSSAAKGGDG